MQKYMQKIITTYWGMWIYLHVFSWLDERGWLASRPGQFAPEVTVPYTNWLKIFQCAEKRLIEWVQYHLRFA
jgi:hypothetical protein